MTQKKQTKPDLTEYEEESLPLDDVLRKLLGAKPEPKKPDHTPEEKPKT